MVIYGYSRKYHSISFSLVTQYVKSCQQSHVRIECCGLHDVHTAKTWQITHISRIQKGISQISKISGKNIRFVALDLKAAQNHNLLQVRLKSESGLSYQHGLEVSPVSPVFLIFLVSLEPKFQTWILCCFGCLRDFVELQCKIEFNTFEHIRMQVLYRLRFCCMEPLFVFFTDQIYSKVNII